MDSNTKLEIAKEVIAGLIGNAITNLNLSTKDKALVDLLNLKERVDSCDMEAIDHVLKVAKERGV